MKVLLTLTVSLLMTFAVLGQGNLEFNQAKFIKIEYVLPTSSSYQSYDQVITVPAGKVWKIESAIGTIKGNSNYVLPSASITLDGSVLYWYSTGSTPVITSAAFPIWLPEGSYTVTLISTNNMSAGNILIGGISAIEFNIMP